MLGKKRIILLITLLYPFYASAMIGVVSKVNVCGVGNVIFKTSTGLYINARHLSGEVFEEGERVSGKLKTYGIQSITATAGRSGNYYIMDIKSSRIDAVHAHCGTRWMK